MTTETVADRVERARSEDMEATLIDNDPVVVQVHNTASDRIHTVIPESIHCSCEDHTYRSELCKHLIFLLMQDGHIGAITAKHIKDYRADLESEANDARERLDDLLFKCRQITDLLSELDVDQDMGQTDREGIEMLQEAVETGDAAIVNDDDAVDQTPDEFRDEFESLVAELTSNGGDN